MLGIFRYLLALAVAASHLWSETTWLGGSYAVFCFYLVSGYLMALILNEVYTARGDSWRYLANRALRIYPPYLAVMLLSVIAAALFASHLDQGVAPGLKMHHVFNQPASWRDWLGNITLLYPPDTPLAVSQGWSLRVELAYYLAMIVLVRHPRRVALWLGLSVVYVFYLHYSEASFYHRYASISGASIAFASGAALYHLRQRYSLPGWHLPVAATLFFTHLLLAPGYWTDGVQREGLQWMFNARTYGLYLNLTLGAYLMFAIVSSAEKAGKLSSFGKVLGDVAYAIFLVHWVVALALVAAGVPFYDRAYFLPVAFVALHIAALAIYLLVEKPVNERLRDRIRR